MTSSGRLCVTSYGQYPFQVFFINSTTVLAKSTGSKRSTEVLEILLAF